MDGHYWCHVDLIKVSLMMIFFLEIKKEEVSEEKNANKVKEKPSKSEKASHSKDKKG